MFKLKSFSQRDTDMTTGGISSNIIKFALPLIAGNLFQQLYNMVDTWVIGQTGENGAYAAVGTVAPIINIIIGFFLGLSNGVGVVISQYFGANDREKVKKTVYTAFVLTVVLCVVFTLIGLFLAPYLLDIMLHGEGSDGEVFPYAKKYLTIYFSGVSAVLIYNMGAGILNAVGDSRRPFIFLTVAAITNTILDLVFVFGFGMGVTGVAVATVIAQVLAAILTVTALLKTDSPVRLCPKEISFNNQILKKIFKLGIPAALQLSVTAVSNVFVQSYIAGVSGNRTVALGGWTTYTKLDAFILLPAQSLALAVTTFVGQNIGCGNGDRAKRGTKHTFFISLVINTILIAAIIIFAPELSLLFNGDKSISDCSTLLIRTLTPFYVLCCVNQIFAGAMRGAGNSTIPMILMLSSFVLFRQAYLFVVSNYVSNDLMPIAFSYPAGWLVCAIGTVVCLFVFGLDGKKRKVN